MSIPVPPAKILSQNSYQVAGKLKITEHFFSVPKDYRHPSSTQNTLRLFARSVRPSDPAPPDKTKPDLPWLLYLNGGPGLPCRSPQSYAFTRQFLDLGYQVLFLDQRGTGLSSGVSASTLERQGEVGAQAEYLKLFRADSIVRDGESIRQALTADIADDGDKGNSEKKKWSLVGQSFGGFCATTYLSFYPDGLKEVFIFGGLPPLVRSPDEVYRRLYRKVKQRNEAYYGKYPADVEHVKTVLSSLTRFGDGSVGLPSGGDLTRRRFRTMGIALGFHGGLDSMHEVILRASSDIEDFGHLTRGALSAIEGMSGFFDDVLLYAILHEPIYCRGNAPNWSAHRVQDGYPEFSIETDGPMMFTGEMVFPWMFDDFAELRKVKDVADLIAEETEWPELYDEEQLARNEVPVYAASYTEDMYVDADFARETARKIKGCKVFETNVIFHDGLRTKMDEVVRHVIALRDDVVD